MRDEFVEICPSFVRLRTHAAQRTARHTQNAAGVGRRTQQPGYHSGAVVPYHDPSNRIAHTPYLSADVCTSPPSHSRLSTIHAARLPHQDRFPP